MCSARGESEEARCSQRFAAEHGRRRFRGFAGEAEQAEAIGRVSERHSRTQHVLLQSLPYGCGERGRELEDDLVLQSPEQERGEEPPLG